MGEEAPSLLGSELRPAQVQGPGVATGAAPLQAVSLPRGLRAASRVTRTFHRGRLPLNPCCPAAEAQRRILQ